jgi:hypothetical protein
MIAAAAQGSEPTLVELVRNAHVQLQQARKRQES